MGQAPWASELACLSASAEGAVEVANFVSALGAFVQASGRATGLHVFEKKLSKFPHSHPLPTLPHRT